MYFKIKMIKQQNKNSHLDIDDFDFKLYLILNPDLPKNWKFDDCVNHWTKFNEKENRIFPSKKLSVNLNNIKNNIDISKFDFDHEIYMKMYPDTGSIFRDCFNHWVSRGQFEGKLFPSRSEKTKILSQYDIPLIMNQMKFNDEDQIYIEWLKSNIIFEFLKKRKKIAVYSANFGNYDSAIANFTRFQINWNELLPSNYLSLNKFFGKSPIIDENVDYILFTDNKNLKSNLFDVRIIPCDEENPRLMARKVKILFHNYLEQYDKVIWFDSCCIPFVSDFEDFIRLHMCGKPLAFKSHPSRNCIYDEMNRVLMEHKDSRDKIEKLKDFYEKDHYPQNNGLVETNVILRTMDKKIFKLMESWWDMIKSKSHRDQLSINYLLWKLNFKTVELEKYFLSPSKFKSYDVIIVPNIIFDYHFCKTKHIPIK